ncbi:hypothetical protein [Sedimentisphaera salicampi]|uniref:Helix-turn-helix domain-containing protein n=1 Tax=Sedimentisphaera salicampi TaxID=1941349 RepID=A0A1W6LLU4_9BACT|nr:hypothetical protein [Sedimentisphaera salicampi]ARN56713.1 hypothetical protein STSP1_01102 [Sedimentisphaera salicampi]
MFFKLDADTAARKDLRASDKIILAIIQNYENQGEAWPGRRKLQEKSGLAGSTICDSIQRLKNAGLLEVQQQGIGKSNIYKTCPKTEPVGKTDQSENQTGTCPKTRPVGETDQSENQTGTCLKTRPVGKSDQSENQAGTCPKTRQEPVRKSVTKRIRKEKSNVDEPSGYAFVLKGGKDYSLPKAKLEEYENTFTTVDTYNPQITQRFFDRIYSPEPLLLRGKDSQDKYLIWEWRRGIFQPRICDIFFETQNPPASSIRISNTRGGAFSSVIGKKRKLSTLNRHLT